MIFGILSGAVIGLFFHQDNWLGGYSSYRRRLFRLGHIAFFGLGFINIFAGLTLFHFSASTNQLNLIVISLIIGTISMPLNCFLSGWKKPFRHLFPIPVIALSISISTMIAICGLPLI